MKWFLSLQLLYLALITPIIHDFYNYDMEKAEFAGLFAKFTQAITDFSLFRNVPPNAHSVAVSK
jgi:hypothetical protein